MKFGHEILKYRDDILRDLAKLIAVPSVCTHPLPGKPFGEAPAQALECILSMAKMPAKAASSGKKAEKALDFIFLYA